MIREVYNKSKQAKQKQIRQRKFAAGIKTIT